MACGRESCCGSADSISNIRNQASPIEETANHHHGHESTEDERCSSADTCCPEKHLKDASISACSITPSDESDARDVERGGPNYERVVLKVKGMTCAGCEAALITALKQMKAVSNIKTGFSVARAEFTLNTNILSAEDVIARLHKTTQFSYTQILEDAWQSLDVTVSNAEAFCRQDQLPLQGIISVTALSKTTVRIQYDAKTVGARRILAYKGWGCSLTLAPLCGDSSLLDQRKQLQQDALFFLATAILTIPVLVFTWASIPGHPGLYDSISLALASIVQFGVVWKFYPPALKDLFFRRTVEVDMLVALSTTTAYVFSVVAYGCARAGKPLQSGQFFDTSTLLASIVLFSRLVSDAARHKAVESVSVRSLQTNTVRLVHEGIFPNRLYDGDKTTSIDTRLLEYNDRFRVPAHSRIVTDGIVVSGNSEVDESMLTGESSLIAKEVNSEVIAGTMNGSGIVDVLVTRLPSENTISTIAKLVDNAAMSKPPIQDISDRVAGYFVPSMIALTIFVFLLQFLIGLKARHHSRSKSVIDAITYAIATLIVSCPCAIALAVPMVVVIAGGVAAKHGVVLKDPTVVEFSNKTSHVIFDKTGTLTQGEMKVVETALVGNLLETDVIPIILGLTADIKHPVAEAIAAELDGTDTPALVDNVKTVIGKGIEGTYNDQPIQAGNCHWLDVESHPAVVLLSKPGRSIFCVKIGGELSTVFALTNPLRPEALSITKNLKSRGIKVSILSGDDKEAVESVASELGIDSENVRYRCTPQDKQDYILTALGPSKSNKVIFVGDGTNDAVALKTATIGIHMPSTNSSRTSPTNDIAKSAANVILLQPNLRGILTVLDISKAAYRRIMFNFAWAVCYNLFAITLAAGAWVRVRIPPAYAALGELVSVLPVVAIALQLRFVRFGRGKA